jgi:hypothetical protein
MFLLWSGLIVAAFILGLLVMYVVLRSWEVKLRRAMEFIDSEQI